MTIKDIQRQHGLPKNVATELMRRLPGASKQVQPGASFASWSAPDGTAITETMIDDARQAAGAPASTPRRPSTPAADAGISDVGTFFDATRVKAAQIAVEGAQLGAAREQAEEQRLAAEVRRRRLEHELETLTAGKPVASSAIEIAKVVTPLLAPIFERMLAPRDDTAITRLVEELRASRAAPPAADPMAGVKTAIEIASQLGYTQGESAVAPVLGLAIQALGPSIPTLAAGVTNLLNAAAAKITGRAAPPPVTPAPAPEFNPAAYSAQLKRGPDPADVARAISNGGPLPGATPASPVAAPAAQLSDASRAALVYVRQAISERRWLDAFTAIGATPELSIFLAELDVSADPFAYVYFWQQLAPEIAMLQPQLDEFLRFCRDHKKELLAARAEEDE